MLGRSSLSAVFRFPSSAPLGCGCIGRAGAALLPFHYLREMVASQHPDSNHPELRSSFYQIRSTPFFHTFEMKVGDGEFRILSLLINQYWQMGPCKHQDGTLVSMKDTMHLSTVTPDTLGTKEEAFIKGI